MPLYTNNLVLSQLPFQTGQTVVRPLFDSSVALRTFGIFITTQNSVRWPVISSDPTAALVGEGQEIPPSNLGTQELISTPVKLAVNLITSKEALEDANGLQATVFDALARALGRSLDNAVFTDVAGFPGLTDVVGASEIDAGSAFTSLDPFISATHRASVYGAQVTAFLANPADAEAIALISDGEGSNRKLMQPVPTDDGIVQAVAGVPLITSPSVPGGIIYGINDSYVHLVLREDINVYADHSVYATSQRVANLGDLRASVAVTLPESLMVIKTS